MLDRFGLRRAVDDLTQDNLDRAMYFTGVNLLGLAPTTIEQMDGSRDARTIIFAGARDASQRFHTGVRKRSRVRAQVGNGFAFSGNHL
jgi:hypothetical protein